ncbi:EAL domain-containing protein [Croceicoccus estronivorus]|uniref:EAL domain-containing protein n=1 Tax=Croceicoccus estronivorus TaxID=1172626 RepID=UPI001478FAE1|nr:EAL domain-containing protein [Croceicoccus estronivorus]
MQDLITHSATGISLGAYKKALDRIANVVCTDLQGYIVYANENFCQLNKCSISDAVGKNNNIFNSGLHGPEFFKQLWKTISAGDIWHGEVCNKALDGTPYWVDMQITPRYDPLGKIIGYLALCLDITARKDAEARAAEENRKRQEMETLLHDIVETLPNGVIAFDKDGKAIFVNSAHEEISSDNTELIDLCRRASDCDHSASTIDEKRCNAHLSRGENQHCKCFIQHLPDDRWVQIQHRRSTTGTLVSVQTDVTDLKHAERKIAYQAKRDPLTGIFNRNTFVERLSKAVTHNRQTHQPCALVRIDLDDFKAINDGLGHDAGDILLRHIAGCLEASVRKTDTVARIGGDEFAILLTGCCTTAEIRRVMGKLSAALAVPAEIGQQTVVQTASMGIATFPHDAENPDELMKCADMALFQCKREGHGTYRIYNMSMRRQRMRRIKLAEELKKSLTNDGFKVVLQPQLDMATGKHTGFEALVRWKVGRKWIPPEDLISVAEEAGLISQLSQKITDKALAMFARLKLRNLNPGTLGINIVAAQLHEPNFVRSLIAALKRHSIRPAEIEIEVTENVILDRSADSIARVLQKLHAEGIAIALDDFGMGYASLTHLKRFPLSRIKIDRSFINGMLKAQDDHVIVRTIISLAHNLGLQVVAEGIETHDQYVELEKLGCDAAQGYLLGRPLDEQGASRHLLHPKLPYRKSADVSHGMNAIGHSRPGGSNRPYRRPNLGLLSLLPRRGDEQA